jgi:hypothetical protein
MTVNIEGEQGRLRVARPCAQHRSGREATRSRTVLIQITENRFFDSLPLCQSPNDWSRMLRPLAAARPRRPGGTAGPPNRLLLSEQLDHPRFKDSSTACRGT